MSDNQHILLLIIIMLLSGILGGLVNYLGVSKEQIQNEKSPFWKRISAGLAASFSVPLFLNMISSSLISDSQTEILKLFVVAGFCIVASISSKAFIDSITKKLLNQVQEIDTAQKNLRDDVEPMIAKETEPTEEKIAIAGRYELDDIDKEVLNALANPKWSMRSLGGILKQTKLKDIEAAYHLSKLCGQGLAKRNTKNGKDWWWLTVEGRAVANEAS